MSSVRPLLFLLFFTSGFCSLVYQLVWTRMAFASFGIITPVLSVVISVFMLGLSIGAWVGGKWIGPLTARTKSSAAIWYAVAEAVIGLGAFAVPRLFSAGERLLQTAGQANSVAYLASSGLILAVSILPWCVLMGATFPLMMAYMREGKEDRDETFSFLYLANVLGAAVGVTLAAVALIEVFGFKDTLQLTAAGNFAIAAIALKLGWGRRESEAPKAAAHGKPEQQPQREPPEGTAPLSVLKWVLFTTGFCSMAMEVVWTRAFAPILKTQVYSFAMVVAVYLAATFVGSWIYRYQLARRSTRSISTLIVWLCMSAVLPVIASEGCFHTPKLGLAIDSPLSVAMLLLSIVPFCAILGYVTPQVVDGFAKGSPSRAGRAYALNVLGCIIGPLVASYCLLPFLSERHALILLALPFFGLFLLASGGVPGGRRAGLSVSAAAVLASGLWLCRSFEEYVIGNDKSMRARRDYAASTICVGQGLDKWLLVNGNSMTSLTPITKFMAHLPLAYHPKPESALVICFGMGTTFRSALSWDIQTTAVELVPGVAKSFDFFFSDAAQYRNNPKGRVVIDDGRRYLRRTAEKYDVIIVDPPPPVEAAGSSLLYSKEFYDVATQHLKPGGILQAWVPENFAVASAALRSLCDSYPHVRCFGSIEGRGVHMLASKEPIPAYTAAELIARMPRAAQVDLLEWSSSTNLVSYLGVVLGNEIKPDKLLPQNAQIRITDDQPYNEYYLLRNQGWW